MASQYLRKFRVPEGYKDVLIELIRNVLKDQPKDIELYCWQYFYAKDQGKEYVYSSLMEQQLLKEMFQEDENSQELISGNLQITSIQATNLPIDELDLAASRIYTLAFLSTNPQGLYKTDEIENNINPLFNVNLNFPIQLTQSELMEAQLILQFYDSGNQKQLIKEAQIDIFSIIEEDKQEVEVIEGNQKLKIECQWNTEEYQPENDQEEEQQQYLEDDQD